VSPDSAPRSASLAGGQASLRPTVTLTSPPAGAETGLDADHHDEAPLRFRTLQNIDDAGSALGLTQHGHAADLLMVDTEEPASF
jgi:hypothetical protein